MRPIAPASVSHVYLDVSGSSCLIPHCCATTFLSIAHELQVASPPCGSLCPISSGSYSRLPDAPGLRPPGSTVGDPFKILPYAARNLCLTRSPDNCRSSSL